MKVAVWRRFFNFFFSFVENYKKQAIKYIKAVVMNIYIFFYTNSIEFVFNKLVYSLLILSLNKNYKSYLSVVERHDTCKCVIITLVA